jgi:hypothetical protein
MGHCTRGQYVRSRGAADPVDGSFPGTKRLRCRRHGGLTSVEGAEPDRGSRVFSTQRKRS